MPKNPAKIRHGSSMRIQSRLLLLLIFLLIPVILVQVVINYQRYLAQHRHEIQENLEASRAVAKSFERFVSDILRQETVAAIVFTLPEFLPEEHLQIFLNEFKERNAAIEAIHWAEPDGRIVRSTDAGAVASATKDAVCTMDRESGEEWAMSGRLGPPAVQRSGFSICRLVREEDGALKGMVVAVIDAASLRWILGTESGRGRALILVDRKGEVVLASPSDGMAEWELRDLPGRYPEMRDVLRGEEASVSLDDEKKNRWLFSLAPVRFNGWAAGVGRREEEVIRPLMSDFQRDAAILLCISLLSFLAALGAARTISAPILRLCDGVKTFGRGRLKADNLQVGGPAEVRELAEAFTCLAETVRSREDSLLLSQNRLEEGIQERTGELVRAMEALKAEIAERRKAEDAVKAERRRLFNLLDSLPAFVYLASQNHLIRFANRAFRNRFGEVDEKPCFEVLKAKREPCEECPKRLVLTSGNVQRWEWKHEPTGRTYETYGYPFTDSDGSYMALMLGIDISARKKAEDALQESGNRLRYLSSQLLSTQEEERRRIAAELHDSLGSLLSAIKFSVDTLSKRTAAEGTIAESMSALQDLIQAAIEETRRMTTDLRPAMLDDLGLLTTIGWFCRKYRAAHPNVTVEECIDASEKSIGEDLKIVVFRILQESFHNITKYSRAGEVTVCLAQREGEIELTVSDNGAGFDPEAVLKSKKKGGGLGIISMKERTMLSGGTFHIESAPGAGTIVRARWPLERRTSL